MNIALGTVQLGLPYGIANNSGQVSRADAKAILSLARSSNIDTLDTAAAYGDSERCLGDIGIRGFKVVTKLPPVASTDISNGAKWVEDQIAGSLKRLDVESVYGLLLHRTDVLAGSEGHNIARALVALKRRGVVEKIGVSIYSPIELDHARMALPLDLVQCPLNIVDRRMSATGWLQKLSDMGVEIHVRSIFLQGLLLMAREQIPSKFDSWARLWDTWHDFLDSNRISAVQACVAFARSFPQVAKIVVGVESAQQLGQLVDAACSPFDLVVPDISSTDERLINPSLWGAL